MSFADTVKNDVAVYDDVETVTLTSKSASGSVSRTIAYALQLELSRSEVFASGGLFTMDDRVWSLPAGSSFWSSSVVAPTEGDTITTSGNLVWTIITVSLEAFGSQYRCVSRLER